MRSSGTSGGVASHEQVEEVGPEQVRQLAHALAGSDAHDVLEVRLECCLVASKLLLDRHSKYIKENICILKLET